MTNLTNSTSLTSSPLLATLSDKDPEAAAAWKAWRHSVDIQNLTWPEMQILPILNGPRLEQWLADDSAAGVLKGIVRRAWSEAQVRLGLAQEVTNCLEQAGCDSVTLIGAVGAYLRSLHSDAIRPILELRILVPRPHLALAARALEAEGWQPRDELPHGEWLDRMTHVLYTRNGTRLYLHWRVLRVNARRADACEREFLSEHRIVEAIGTSFRILAPGHALLETLAEREETVDVLAWQADAALILREPPALRELPRGESIDWARWSVLAARYQPQVFERVPELRAMGLGIPALREPKVWPGLLPLTQFVETLHSAVRSWARRISASMGKA
jgi:hypothetical protein